VAWVVGPDEIVSRRPVKIGEASGGQIEITEGLQPGDRIAVAGVTFLREGMKVRDLGDALTGGRS
jgi:multidrug efflux pump subunit AcrA (membrane-fusion protein)